MPNVTAQDLRRLRSLEGRLVKAGEAKKKLTADRRKLTAERRKLMAERRELRAELTATRKEAATAARDALHSDDQLQQRIAALIEENKNLATQLKALTREAAAVRQAGARMKAQNDQLKERLAGARREVTTHKQELGKAVKARDRLQKRVTVATKQIQSREMAPVLPAGEVAFLINDFLGQVKGGVKGLAMSTGEIKLKVGFGKVDQDVGFLVPTAENVDKLGEGLHEVTFKLDRVRDSE